MPQRFVLPARDLSHYDAPLRERPEDIGALAVDFLTKLSADVALPRKELTREALSLLQRRRWAGNVRELQHAIERAFILAGNATLLSIEHFVSPQDGHRLRKI